MTKVQKLPEPGKNNSDILERIDASIITDQSDISDPIPFVKVNGSTFASLGDISFVSGAPKAGKSSITQFIIGTALMKHKPTNLDSLGIVSDYQEQRPIIYIDTEQHKAHTKKRLNAVLKLANLPKQDTTLLKVMNWRECTQTERFDRLKQVLDVHKDACLWIIDGITDFVASANNEEAGNVLISFLMQKASENNAAIILLIHENAGNGKLRGHIGSEAERKCGGAISVKKDKEKGVHIIEPKYLRDAKDFDPVLFQWNDELCRMSTVESSTAQAMLKDMKEKSKGSQLRQLYERCMGTDSTLTRVEFRKRIENDTDPDKRSSSQTREQNANRKIKEMEQAFFIKLKGEGKSQTVEPFQMIDNPQPYEDESVPF